MIISPSSAVIGWHVWQSFSASSFPGNTDHVVWSCSDAGIPISPSGETCSVYGENSSITDWRNFTLTCIAYDAGNHNLGSASASCSVVCAPDTSVHVTSVSVSPTLINFTSPGQTATLTATISPSDATDKSVYWNVGDVSIASVSANGLTATITANNFGSTVVTVTTNDGNKSASCSISVNNNPTNVPVTGVTLDRSSASVTVGSTIQLNATVQPSNATNKGVTWSSSNSGIASVNSSGLVTGVAAGTATITVRTNDGGYTTSCTVTVTSSGGGTPTRPPNWSWSYSVVSGGAVYRTQYINGIIKAYYFIYSEWNSFTSRINEFRRYRSLSDFAFTQVTTEGDFTTGIVNEAIHALNAMGYSHNDVAGDITAGTLNEMVSFINSIT